MITLSNLREICGKFSFERLYHYNNITNNKLQNIIAQLGINNDEIIVFYDGTVWQSGKNGVAICESGIYWKNILEPSRYLTWNQFKKVKLTKGDGHIYLGDQGKIFVYDNEMEKLFSLLSELKMTIKIDNLVEKTVGFFGFLEKAANFIDEMSQEVNRNNQNAQIVEETQLLISDNNFIEADIIEIKEEIAVWTIAGKNFKIGPYSTEEVKNWLSNNQNELEKVYVWKKGMNNWELIRDIPEFKDYIKSNDEMPPLPIF